MKERAISAILFTVIMLAGVFGGALPFTCLFLLIAGGSAWELLKMLADKDTNYALGRRLVGAFLGVWPLLLFLFHSKSSSSTIDGPLLWALFLLPIFMLLLTELFLQAAKPFQQVGNYLLALIYIGIPFALLADIASPDQHYSAWRVFGLLLLNWMNDTFAYLTGYFIGKTPFFPRISPKKTWEGTIGGIVFTFLFAWALSNWISCYSVPQWLAIATVVAIFGTLGDLVESMLKRSVGVKDSGAILPGHGGFLDRFDSLIVLTPFVWLVLQLLNH
jgi:phosphatidate cytidylyltransferase